MRKALFLDRDGVVNRDFGYVGHFTDFEFMPGIFELVLHYQNKGFLPVIVTNQSGIARGYYSEADFHTLMKQVMKEFNKHGISTFPVYYCPHHQEGIVARYALSCKCRKPEAGMFLSAAKEHEIDISQSIMVGDSWRDILAADIAGVRKSFFLSAATPNQKESAQLHQAHHVTRAETLADLLNLSS
ncbi:hypothetical protein BK026_04570 [Alteromonas sp. V450]|uniref:D-glycero-alpha-D-manno-heptose-1,7-bisphosphate 7-phosphatase n=1 Tax=Alteromonas sp. V450 TaxID=1912139 RepID=UPI0008FF184F|nr:HAD family hydrolase [Alteromonas sp. V450]OJF68110.1 hypothetical protein BK026_04570 [Alteromonas sp. V450]